MNGPKRLVLVTGASGFLGKHMVRTLAANGWAVRAASRDPAAIPEAAGVERVALPDLVRDADWAPLVEGATHIVHLAGIAHAPGHLLENVYNRINRDVVGELAGAARGRVERFVLMSTVRAQAGLASDHVITEADPPLPTDIYGQSKLEAERLLAGSGGVAGVEGGRGEDSRVKIHFVGACLQAIVATHRPHLLNTADRGCSWIGSTVFFPVRVS